MVSIKRFIPIFCFLTFYISLINSFIIIYNYPIFAILNMHKSTRMRPPTFQPNAYIPLIIDPILVPAM